MKMMLFYAMQTDVSVKYATSILGTVSVKGVKSKKQREVEQKHAKYVAGPD